MRLLLAWLLPRDVIVIVIYLLECLGGRVIEVPIYVTHAFVAKTIQQLGPLMSVLQPCRLKLVPLPRRVLVTAASPEFCSGRIELPRSIPLVGLLPLLQLRVQIIPVRGAPAVAPGPPVRHSIRIQLVCIVHETGLARHAAAPERARQRCTGQESRPHRDFPAGTVGVSQRRRSFTTLRERSVRDCGVSSTAESHPLRVAVDTGAIMLIMVCVT